MEIANRIAKRVRLRLASRRSAVKLASRSNLDEGLPAGSGSVSLCFSTEDKNEGVSAFLEKRNPTFSQVNTFQVSSFKSTQRKKIPLKGT
jgi:enoyl-CoA hydratase/carnithine racemase